MALVNAFDAISLEATQQDIKTLTGQIADMQAEIKALSETLLYFVTSVLEKMPRVDAADRLMVSHAESNPTVSIASAQTLATLTTAGTLQNMGAASRPADAIPMHIGNAGALHIYDNVRFS